MAFALSLVIKFSRCRCSVFIDRDGVEIHKHAKKKERGQYPAISTEQVLAIKSKLYGKKNPILMRNTAGNPGQVS